MPTTRRAAPKNLAELAGLEDLLPIYGEQRFVLRAINEQGQVVGSERLYSKGPEYIMSDSFPVLWDGGKAVQIDQCLASYEDGMKNRRIRTVMGINNMGQIIVVCEDEFTRQERIYLLTPSADSDGRACNLATRP